MKESHKGMGITEAEFNALAGDLIDTLKEFKVPQKEIDELIAIIATTKGDIVEPEAKKEEPKKEEPKLVEPKKEEAKKEEPKVKPKETPLWDRLGGEKSVRAVVHDFVITAATNPKVNFLRDGKVQIDEKGVEKLEQLLVELISATTGGPLKYTGRSMKESHKGMAITEDEFNAIAGDLIATLKKFKVPQKEIDELIAIVATTKDDIVEVKKK
jgi:hemoglobin